MRFHPLAPVADLASGYRKAFEVAGCHLLLIVDGEERYLAEALCPHMGSRLDGGEVQDGRIRCPHHLYQFDLRSGECLTAGAFCDPLRLLPVAVEGDWVGVDLNVLADWL